MIKQNFDEIIVNKNLIALYKFPKEQATYHINNVHVKSLFQGILPITQQNLVKILPNSTLNQSRIPAFNGIGAEKVNNLADKLDLQQNPNSLYNTNIKNQIITAGQNYDYLTSDCVGYFNRTHTQMIAQSDSYDMNLTKANIGALVLNHNVNNSGILRSEIPALEQQAKHYPADVDYVINHNLYPMYQKINLHHQYHTKLLLGYHVTNQTNGLAVVCANNRANRILVNNLLKYGANSYYASYKHIINVYLNHQRTVVQA